MMMKYDSSIIFKKKKKRGLGNIVDAMMYPCQLFSLCMHLTIEIKYFCIHLHAFFIT